MSHPECVAEALLSAAEKMGKLLSWSKAAKTVEEGVEKIGGRISVGWEFGSLHGVLWHLGESWSSDKAEHVTRSQLVAAIRFLRQAGFKKWNQEDYEEVRRRSYYFKNEEGTPIVLSAFFAEEAACHFEVVGQKEVPVYELKCDGEIFDPEDSETEAPA